MRKLVESLTYTNHHLRLISGRATHQHYRGGLYELIGSVKDADTGLTVEGKVLYKHLWPHAVDYWVRSESEFHETIVRDGYSIRRFRSIESPRTIEEEEYFKSIQNSS